MSIRSHFIVVERYPAPGPFALALERRLGRICWLLFIDALFVTLPMTILLYGLPSTLLMVNLARLGYDE